ncbi:propionate catabolism operon regulatory protein PrpR [Pusillimonas sp. TS35]|uniref:propionate catabolism operon regulatory protein PrpR n=1 Tax=Paracandidimonas lactea TaxID=2895524 RepID=UPI00136DD916|nr:propionate catabolism operon regulatory protein PrpR [Paracandidimonas lactea]MYN13749.1 propionate catabolism operon regulatory protein PrpR [Pusillimonas sp. TS35]
MAAVFAPTPDARLRLVAVGMHEVRLLFEALAPQYSTVAEIAVLDKAYGEAVDGITAMRQARRIDAIVSAGSNGTFLRQHLDIPVVLVKAGGLDMLRGLAQASRDARRIALVSYGSVPTELRHFNELFSLALELRAYTTEDEAEACVRELLALGVDAVVGHGLVVDLARSYGMEGILLYSQGAVREAIEDAIEVARISRLEAARRDKLNSILGRLRDGVIAVDLEERVETVNPAMTVLIGQPAEAVVGRRLSSVNTALSLQETLRTGQPDVECVAQLGGKTVVLSRLPVLEQGRQTGAVLVCQDPVAIQRLDRSLRSRSRPRTNTARYGLDQIIGESPATARVRDHARVCARHDATVLISGESGTGKELLAQGIHNASARRAQPFVAINCAAFPDALLESELFGYVDGAFTGSSRGGKIGLFEAAHTGTIFLDEIGEMPLSLQTRLLRVLQEREILRIGATEPTPVDVRVIAATHQDLGSLARNGRFRGDLYYRLNILRLELPPLRARQGDVPLLAAHLRDKIAARLRTADPSPGTAAARDAMVRAIVEASKNYAWPGNIRELENLIERAMVFYEPVGGGGGDAARAALRNIAPELFVPAGASEQAAAMVMGDAAVSFAFAAGGASQLNAGRVLRDEEPGSEGGMHADLRSSRDAAERVRILAALDACGGNREQAAVALGISRTTLWRKLRSYT